MRVVDRTEAIVKLVRMLEDSGCVRDTFLRAVLDREELYPTGIRLDGPISVALPHADPEHVISSAFAVGVLDAPVKFRYMADPRQELGVEVVFVMAAKEPGEVTSYLQRLAEGVFQRRDVVAAIRGSASDAALEEYLREVVLSAPDGRAGR